MRNRFKNTLYTVEDLKYLNGRWQYVRSEDGTLFSGPYRTKIKPEDLPEWYVCGRYYKRFGYMSTKGIADLLYIPCRFSNHYLKGRLPADILWRKNPGSGNSRRRNHFRTV